jgi:serine/threonine-protein kinase HipA
MTDVHVYTELAGGTLPVGTLRTNLRNRRLTSVFTYDGGYLAAPSSYAVDPSMPLTSGGWPAPGALPRAFQDSAPDRWGRNLIRKRVVAEATRQGVAAPALDDLDYLLGVSDRTRQGSLRYALDLDTGFVAADGEVPKLVALPELLDAATRVARDEDGLDAVKVLLAAGTGSLGGARPKASVHDGDALLIAKFPHPGDAWDVMAWEKTALDLAASAGIDVPKGRLERIGDAHVLLLDRFDREGASRVGYISAMSLLEASDGDQRDYIDLAEGIADHGARTAADLVQLWRRVVFSIAVHNTDDHLRNHGFLRLRGGWGLAPMFDVNPNPDVGEGRATSIGGVVGAVEEARAALASAEFFGLEEARARLLAREVLDAVRAWRERARSNGIIDSELHRFEPMFERELEF